MRRLRFIVGEAIIEAGELLYDASNALVDLGLRALPEPVVTQVHEQSNGEIDAAYRQGVSR